MVEVVRYVVVDDVGTVINPLLLKGQIHGGVAQGLGQALMERIVFADDSGQLVTGSFMDYCMPRADDMTPIDVESNGVPTDVNPLGVTGCRRGGDGGCVAGGHERRDRRPQAARNPRFGYARNIGTGLARDRGGKAMNAIDLTGRVAIVTGGGRGLGRAMTLALVGAGANVAAAMHISDDIERIKNECADLAGDVHPMLADVRDPDDCRRVVDQTCERFDGPHMLVNNAGVGMLLVSDSFNRDPTKFWGRRGRCLAPDHRYQFHRSVPDGARSSAPYARAWLGPDRKRNHQHPYHAAQGILTLWFVEGCLRSRDPFVGGGPRGDRRTGECARARRRGGHQPVAGQSW